MIVDIEQIAKLFPSDANLIFPNENSGAMGPTDDQERPTLFDAMWGYFSFGQSVATDYGDDSWAYQDVATFTISGIFTPDAVIGDTSELTDDQVFRLMTTSYNALDTLFTNCAAADAPTEYSLWGTTEDKRCLMLPLPLVTSKQARIFALPQSLRLEKTQWASEIKYTAALMEAVPPPTKLAVNEHLVDGAVVTFTLPAPELSRRKLIRCAGEVVQVLHYNSMGVDVQGSIPADDLNLMLTDIYDQQINLSAFFRGGTEVPVWSGLNPKEDIGVDTDLFKRVSNISLSLKE